MAENAAARSLAGHAGLIGNGSQVVPSRSVSTQAASNPLNGQCSFCQRQDGRSLLQSRTDAATYICEECVRVCISILEDDRTHPPSDEEPAALPSADESLHCSFCARSQSVVDKLISAPKDRSPAYICDACTNSAVAASAKIERPAFPQFIWRRLTGKPPAIQRLE